MDSPANLLSLEVPCDRHAPAVVRAALLEVHDNDWSLDDGLLLASELVTNAVLRSGCPPGRPLSVRASLRHDCLLISVQGPRIAGQRVRRRVAEGWEPGAWGLRIVEQLARRWGSERPDGYRVWAELAAYC